MNHSDIQHYMPDYLEGDLALDRRALVDAHLDECPDCARDIAGFRSTIAALRGLPDPVAPTDLTANVMRRVRMGEGRTSLLDRIRVIAAGFLAPRILAPASAALLAAGLILGTGDLRNQLDAIRDDFVGGPVPSSDTVRDVELAGQNVSDVRSTLEVESSNGGSVVDSGFLPGGSVGPTTQGQELIALSQSMDERSGIRTRFNDWPAARPASTVAVALNPVGPVVERSTSSFLPGPLVDAGQRWPSADEWLVHLRQRPAEFADLMALRTLAEQEHWIDRLAHRALSRGELDEIVTVLRSSGSERARILAEDFAAVSSSAAADDRPATISRD